MIIVQFVTNDGRDVDRVAYSSYNKDEFNILAKELGLIFGRRVRWYIAWYITIRRPSFFILHSSSCIFRSKKIIEILIIVPVLGVALFVARNASKQYKQWLNGAPFVLEIKQWCFLEGLSLQP